MNKTAWMVPAWPAMLWERFEDSFFLFNPLSGETHVLNEQARLILEQLGTRPATLEEILARQASVSSAGTDREDPARPFRDLLSELDRLGLIAPVPR
ncbi:MAG: HPr-rel-A system PqqD family peptide chaperone [Magnetococcales bacterium]|nr:HPr-rel-A system PqqD family peptide chaperone [Magnetococcales bacterium]